MQLFNKIILLQSRAIISEKKFSVSDISKCLCFQFKQFLRLFGKKLMIRKLID